MVVIVDRPGPGAVSVRRVGAVEGTREEGFALLGPKGPGKIVRRSEVGPPIASTGVCRGVEGEPV